MRFQKVVLPSAGPHPLFIPATQIRFLGGKLGTALANEYDVSTIEALL
jgi:hypothetical protein